MLDTSLAFSPAYEIAQRIRRKEVSPIELIDLYLERIAALNPKLNAYLTVAESEARSAASAAEKALATEAELPPLHGVPIAIKDTEYTKGIRTTMGSQIYEDFVPEEDSIIVERLRQAGTIILGKTNTPEFACSGKTYRLEYRNPWNTERTPGGSSGGSAAAVASGLTSIATGSDFGGSIRIPAGYCGVFGIKPTHGRIPTYPSLIDMILMLDAGPLTRTVRDAALMLDVTAGHDRRDPMSLREKPPDFLGALDGPLPKLKVAWSPNLGFAHVGPEVQSMAEAGCRVFESLGCNVETANLGMDDPMSIRVPIFNGDELAVKGHLLESHAAQLMPRLKQRLEDGRKTTAADYSNALRELFRLRSKMADFFEEYDLLVLPTNPVTAFANEGHTVKIGDQIVDDERDTISLTLLGNITGLPAASIPCGFASDGLPVGLQVIGKWGDETTILRACAAFEQAQPWIDKIPPMAS